MAKEIGKDIKRKDIPEEDFLDGWLSSDKYLPTPFDLVHVKENLESKSVPAWWGGQKWEGYRILNKKYDYWKWMEV